MRLYDLGAEVDLARVTRLLDKPVPRHPAAGKPATMPGSPANTFPKPLEVASAWPEGGPGATMQVRLHSVGVVAVRLRWTVDVDGLDDVQEAASALPGGMASIDSAIETTVAQARISVASALTAPYIAVVQPERYLVYCIQAGPGEATKLLSKRRARIAALISGEPQELALPARVDSAFKHMLQSGPDDAVLPGWDHAVVVGRAGEYEDVLDVMELANVELLEFRTYDAYLDRRLDASYAALDKLWARGGIFRSASRSLQDMSRLRLELTRLTDNLHDTGKVFGDWYHAQLHKRLYERFHLESWQRVIAHKMDALEDMFQLAQEEANRRRSLLLEALIVLLFVLDLAIVIRHGI